MPGWGIARQGTSPHIGHMSTRPQSSLSSLPKPVVILSLHLLESNSNSCHRCSFLSPDLLLPWLLESHHIGSIASPWTLQRSKSGGQWRWLFFAPPLLPSTLGDFIRANSFEYLPKTACLKVFVQFWTFPPESYTRTLSSL